MKYALVIFDLDGTLLDTLEDLTDSTNNCMRKFGFPEHTKEEVRGFVGNGIRKLIERSLPVDTAETVIEECFREFKIQYQSHCAIKTRPYDGIPELLQTMKAAGIHTAVVSNKADAPAKELCRRYFPGLLDAVVGEREGIRRKPAPDTVNEVIRLFGIPREEVIYIGDSDVDIQTAQNAGVACIGVDWGFRERHVLKEAGAKNIVSAVSELLSLLL